jgi:hypothetical protein
MAGSPPPIDSAEVRSRVLSFLNETGRSVSSIYTSYVRPFAEVGGSFSDFLISSDELLHLPPNTIKIRMHFYQIFLRLDLYAQDGTPDPLPDDQYKEICSLIRAVSPLAFALGSAYLVGLLGELRTVHFAKFPETIQRIEDDLGVSDREPTFLEPEEVKKKRTHYREAAPEAPRPLAPVVGRGDSRGLLRGRTVELGKTIKVRIKKSHHGPTPVKPTSFDDK